MRSVFDTQEELREGGRVAGGTCAGKLLKRTLRPPLLPL